MNRRNWLQNILGGSVAAAAFAYAIPAEAQLPVRRRNEGKGTMKRYDNAHFYKDGKFNTEAAIAAYDELFRHFHYSLANVTKDKRFWAVDFGLGDFVNVGMGGIFWVNDKEHGYFGHEIYLLPGQMIPEHSHVPAEDKAAKHEYWQVRHGNVWTFAQGGSKNDKLPIALPKSQLDANAITAFIPHELKVGGEAPLRALGEWHFMIAGPEGAIVTEFGSFHSNQGLKFQNTKAKL